MKKPLLLLVFAFCALPANGQVNVLTYRSDNLRSGQNLSETTLTNTRVNSSTFGKVYTLSVDGYVYAQPLHLSNLAIPGKGTRNVVFIATEHDSVYAFDADTTEPLWQVSFINPSAGVTTEPASDTLTTDIVPEVGITSTPVIDATSGTLYVVVKTKENGGQQIFRLHALDVTTGLDKVTPAVIQASVPGNGGGSSGGTLRFDATWQFQRPGLVLSNGTVYVGFGSTGDNNNWHGWMLAYNATNLSQTAAFCTTPNGFSGGIWASGQAPPVDVNGNIYFTTGNGDFNGSTGFGDAYIKLSTSSGLRVLDFFAPFNQGALNSADLDIASAGLTLLPDSFGTTSHPHLIIGSGKDGTIYVLDRDSMGGYNGSYTNPDSQIVQEIWNALGGTAINPTASSLPYVENNFSTPTYWQNHIYWSGINDPVKMFNMSNGLLTTTPVSKSTSSYQFKGSQPVITASSSTATSAILWAIENGPNNNVLHAYDATNLASELYNSGQAAGNRDLAGPAVKFVVATVANGRVFVGSQYEVDVYGILSSNQRLAAPTFTPPPGNYPTSQSVTISESTDPAATIYYTTDGSLPTTSSTQYTGAIQVSGPITIKAIAGASGFLVSPVTTASYTIGTQVAPLGFVQGNFAVPHPSATTVTVPYLGAQGPGDLNVVIVGWNDSTANIVSVSDSLGNIYTPAVGPTVQTGAATQAIYYAQNIPGALANTNSVTVTFDSAAASPDIRILEYGGVDTSAPLDVATASTGNSTNSNSGSVTTANADDLIIGANLVQTGTSGPGAGFTSRMITIPDGDIAEDKIVATTGSYSATAPVGPAGQWIMQMVAFKAAGAAPTPTAPSNLTATAGSSTQISLSWTASTESGGTISQYLIERCPGTGCSNFAQVGTSTATSFGDTGLSASTSYSYRVRASDSSSRLGAYSNIATATTLAGNSPTAPSNLAATPSSSTQINLSWTASTETGGTIGQYLIERCQGSGCSNFAQVGTSTSTSFGDGGLLAATNYSYRVRASDTSNNLGPYSNIAGATTSADTTPPTSPSSLTTTAASNVQINLSWTASSDPDSPTITYLVERCQGSGCSNFAQVGTSTTTTFSSTGLTAATSYSYRVRATDAASNLSPYSNVASATTLSTPPPPPTISFIQVRAADPQTPQTTVAVTYAAAQRVGDLNVVVVGWNDSTATVSSVKDTLGNVYTLAVGPTVQGGTATQSIYYAKNIPAAAANGNTVTVTFSVAARFPDIVILEYSGLDTVNPLDVAAAATGNSTTSSSGAVTTTNVNDLLIGANVVQTGTTGAGTGFTRRIITSPDGDIAEDRIVTALGSYSATAPVSPSGLWVMQMVAFKAAGSAPTPTAPSNLTATAAGSVQINLSWTAATETGGTIANYLIERCAGAACSTFAQVGTSTATTFSDTNLLGSTSYSYRVRAIDTANTTGPYSNTASATTAAPTFVVPSNLTATTSGPAQINLSWTAAAETGGTITNYLIERCSGACGSFTQMGTSTGTTFNDTGLLGSTAYSYRVRATDGTNFSGYSNTSSATTAAPTFTAPSNLTATAASNTQINLSWTAATETGGTISQYLIERCSGANCGNTPSNFAQVGTTATTAFSDTGLTASTSYSYRVRATDASSNFSLYSNTASATTLASVPTAPSNLTATAAGPVQINLSWTASTESGGTIASYLIERCTGAACSTFAQVGTSTITTFSDTGLLGSTAYSYRVRAMDAVNATGPYSNTASATTAAPTFVAPSNLTATAVSPVQVNLSWTAATETGGTPTNYLIERCSGTCSTFAQVGTSTTTSFSNTGLLGSTAYSYRVRVTDGTNFSTYSNTASATTAAPTFTAPSNLAATPISNTQINLSWTAATETGGTISQYLVESCQGASCSTFAQVGTSTTTTFSNTGLLAATSYSYRVRATDGTNFSLYSNTASATTLSTPPPPPTISFIQVNSADPQTPQATVAVTYTAAQRIGDLNVVVVGWNDSTATVNTVTDTMNNVYALAVGPTVQTGTATQSIYYAKNITAAAAGANTVTVKFNGSAIFPDIRILEYSGLDTTNPLDVAAGASGTSATSSSAVTTTNANDLIIGANVVQTGTTGAGTGFTRRIITSPDSDIVEDRVVTAIGSYTATAPVSPSASWIMQVVAFKAHP